MKLMDAKTDCKVYDKPRKHNNQMQSAIKGFRYRVLGHSASWSDYCLLTSDADVCVFNTLDPLSFRVTAVVKLLKTRANFGWFWNENRNTKNEEKTMLIELLSKLLFCSWKMRGITIYYNGNPSQHDLII